MKSPDKLICIIEDNKGIRKMFNILLTNAGYNTIEFEDGGSASQWLNENKADCVLVDLLLPDMNGAIIMNIIRNKRGGKKIPIIAVTGIANAGDKNKYLRLGFDDFISKPVDTKDFAVMISEIIKKKLKLKNKE